MRSLPVYLVLALVTISKLQAQKIEFGMSTGTGKSYIFESIDNSINVKYGLPTSFLTEIKYSPTNSGWGLKLRLHNVSSNVRGENWENKTPLNGNVNSFTTSFLLEKELQKKKFAYAFNFGFGYTKEKVQPVQYATNTFRVKNFASIIVGGNLSYSLGKNFDFQILPILLWNDPASTLDYLAGSGRANLAGEDLSMLLNFGIRYRLSK